MATVTGWDAVDEKAKEFGTGIFVKLGDGEGAQGAFVGSPVAHETLWLGGKSVEYDESNPEHKAHKPSLRFRFNFFVPGEGFKIIDQGVRFFGQVKALRKKGLLDTHLIDITRTGSTKDNTSYMLIPLRPLTDEEKKAIAEGEPHDLTKTGGEDDGDSGAKPAGNVSSDFIGKLKARLKGLPGESINAFLERFSVARIGDITPEQHTAADDFVTELEAKRDGTATSDVDPFA